MSCLRGGCPAENGTDRRPDPVRRLVSALGADQRGAGLNRWPLGSGGLHDRHVMEEADVLVDEPKYRIRATHTADTITVYQAYRPEIGLPAARDGRFPEAWKRDRMTWIKPSFLWMMYRCGWGTKEGQESVLAVEITREGFDWALRNACLSSYQPGLHTDRTSWQRQLKRSPPACSGIRNATCGCSRCRTARCSWAWPARPRTGTPMSGSPPSPM